MGSVCSGYIHQVVIALLHGLVSFIELVERQLAAADGEEQRRAPYPQSGIGFLLPLLVSVF